MLSPVSKLERAKQMARLEQRKRMDAACSEKVTSKIVNAKKRKQVERRLESHIKKKIKSQDDAEISATIFKPTRSRTSRRAMVEGNDIAHSLMTKKDERQRPVKTITQKRGESATEYALRASKERRLERQSLPVRRVVLPQEESSSDEEEEEDEVSEEVEEEERVLKDGAEDYPSDDEEEKPPARRSYWKFFYHLWVVTALLAVVAAYFMMEDLPYCESLTDSTTNQCRPCPDFGICLEGKLYRCQEPYTVFRDECIESAELQMDAARMRQDINVFLASFVEKGFCSTWQVDPEAETVLRLSRSKLYREIRKGRSWKASPEEVFNVTFGKAAQSLSFKADEIEIPLSAAPLWCQLLHFQAKNPRFSIGILLTILLGGFLVRKHSQRRYEKRVVDDILSQVQDILIDQSKASKDDLREYPVDNLRDHVFDVLGFPHSERKYVIFKIWPKIHRMVQADSRIRERAILHRGRQVVSWEWISQNLTKSNDRRRSKTPEVKKTLDFGSSRPRYGPSADPVTLF